MVETSPPPDLFDVLLAEYRKWLVEPHRQVTVNDKTFIITLPGTPADRADEFIAFCREYLKVNPVVGQGSSLGTYAVLLADRRHIPLARGVMQEMESGISRLAVPVTGVQHMGPHDFLPPSHAVPITKGQ